MTTTRSRAADAAAGASNAAEDGAAVPPANVTDPGAPQRLMVSREEAAAMLGLCPATFDRARAAGTVPAGVVMTRDSLGRPRVVRWSVAALRQAVTEMDGVQQPGRRRR